MYVISAVAMNITETSIIVDSVHLNRRVMVSLYSSADEGLSQTPSLLLLNDGQEAPNLNLPAALEDLYESNRIRPIVIAAIHAGKERINEYGTAGKPDFKQRGAKADLYTSFVTEELLPEICRETGIEAFDKTAFAGFSLGGLSALDIAWNHPEVFDAVGVFSGSLWWRERDLKDGYTDSDRIMHKIIREGDSKPDLKFFLQTGTKDELADRNQNGIIDSIDDTIDLIIELENKGYTRPADISYLEVIGGRHDILTWAANMPKFLCWAFSR